MMKIFNTLGRKKRRIKATKKKVILFDSMRADQQCITTHTLEILEVTYSWIYFEKP